MSVHRVRGHTIEHMESNGPVSQVGSLTQEKGPHPHSHHPEAVSTTSTWHPAASVAIPEVLDGDCTTQGRRTMALCVIPHTQICVLAGHQTLWQGRLRQSAHWAPRDLCPMDRLQRPGWLPLLHLARSSDLGTCH